MIKRSTKSGSILVAAVAFALSAAACSSGSTVAASSTSSSSVSATGTAASSSASESAASATSATSTTSASTSEASTSEASTSASTSSRPEAPAITNKTSDWVERNGFKIKVDSVTYPFLPPAGQGIPPGPNESLLKLRIEVINTGKDSDAFTPGDCDIRDSGNRSFVHDIVRSDDLPKNVQFGMGSLKPGEKEIGEAVFAGPSDAKGLRLVFLAQLMARDGSGVATDPKPVVDLGV